MGRAILVTGATGKQGGALIKALVDAKAGFQILAVTRDTNSPSAKRLAAKSPDITLVQGDLDDTEAVFESAERAATSRPIWGVFSVQAITVSKEGPAVEQRQGRALVDSAVRHGVGHFVYSSVDRHGESSLDNPTDVPHFASKHHIEHHLIDSARGAGMSWTILRPVAFMDNLGPDRLGRVFAAAWRLGVRSRPLQLVAVGDVGVFAAKAFLEPDRFAGRELSLAGDELTFDQMARAYRDKTGADPPLAWPLLARLVLWLSAEMGTMVAFYEREGFAADIPALRQMHPALKDFRTWLGENRRSAGPS